MKAKVQVLRIKVTVIWSVICPVSFCQGNFVKGNCLCLSYHFWSLPQLMRRGHPPINNLIHLAAENDQPELRCSISWQADRLLPSPAQHSLLWLAAFRPANAKKYYQHSYFNISCFSVAIHVQKSSFFEQNNILSENK